MAKTQFMNSLTRTMNRTGLKIKKYSPEILLVTGLAGVVTGAVMACRATTKASAVIEKHKKNIEAIHEVASNPAMVEEYNYTEKDYKKDLTITHAKTGLEFVKLYAPAVLVGAAGIGCILASHNIIHKRNVALGAAYAAVDRSFKEYRGRVVERLGKEMDRELRYNIKAEEVEETVTNEDGTQTTITKTVQTYDPNAYSEYSVVFDDGNRGWDPDPFVTKAFLVQTQNYFNDMLQTRGHVYLNEVYDELGVPRTKAGQQVGWVLGGGGDDYIDFGIFDIKKPKANDFVNGREKVIILDFNVDGYILDLMK